MHACHISLYCHRSRLVPCIQVAVDFFGRPIVPKEKTDKGGSVKSGPKVVPYRVAYKFNEGNSAAVRKPVKVSAFL